MRALQRAQQQLQSERDRLAAELEEAVGRAERAEAQAAALQVGGLVLVCWLGWWCCAVGAPFLCKLNWFGCVLGWAAGLPAAGSPHMLTGLPGWYILCEGGSALAPAVPGTSKAAAPASATAIATAAAAIYLGTTVTEVAAVLPSCLSSPLCRPRCLPWRARWPLRAWSSARPRRRRQRWRWVEGGGVGAQSGSCRVYAVVVLPGAIPGVSEDGMHGVQTGCLPLLPIAGSGQCKRSGISGGGCQAGGAGGGAPPGGRSIAGGQRERVCVCVSELLLADT